MLPPVQQRYGRPANQQPGSPSIGQPAGTLPALLLGLVCLAASSGIALAKDKKGVLDIPTAVPTTGSATQQSASASELEQQMKEMKKALKAERRKLKKMNRGQLKKLARQGERAAQLVLAENFADEAHRQSITLISANDALSDAAYWYSLAARRGFPGSPSIDGTLPTFPLRAIR